MSLSSFPPAANAKYTRATADPLSHMQSNLTERFNRPGHADRLAALPIQPGKRADYLALKAHHYRPGNPATMTRILTIRDPTPTASDRYLARTAQPSSIAVLVESYPVLSCRLREAALGGRYGHLPPKPRSALLMQELRCISRVIIDPRYRGLGLAVRLVRHAIANATTRYTESIAVMGKVSPFFQRAGMTAYERQPLEADQRALAALCFVGIEPNRLATPNRMTAQIEQLKRKTRCFVTKELTRWYRTNGGRGVVRQPDLATILAAAQQRLLAQPVYYLHENTHVPAHCTAADESACQAATH